MKSSSAVPAAVTPGLACPICLCRDMVFFAQAADRLFGLAPGGYRLYRCTSCGCVFQHPMPDEGDLAGFYPESYWWDQERQAASSVAGYLARLEKSYREFVALDHVRFLERCARQSPGSGRTLLDIGCGSGTFLHLSRGRGFVVHGMDLSAQAVEVARRQYGLDVRRGDMAGNAWEGQTFDFITMFHVLEHLPEPRKALHFAVAHLKPGGSLIIQVPNLDSLQSRFFGSCWYGLDVPRHVINFTSRGLHRLLSDVGLQGKALSRFSLRDNPASIASSLIPALDPIGRKGRRLKAGVLSAAAAEITYFALFLAALPLAAVESALGFGGTLWVNAKPVCG